MCDFSLHHVKSRPAKVGDSLMTCNFNTGTRGFAAPEDSTRAVCILPGTELAFSEEVKCAPVPWGFSSWRTRTVNFKTAIFRQINKDQLHVHHDALEFPGWHLCSLDALTRRAGGNGASTSGITKNAGRGSSPQACHLDRLTSSLSST